MRLVQFSATWCGPCKMVSPIIQKISEDTGIALKKVDIDENPMVSELHNVMSVPTIIKFDDNGIEVARVVGAKPEKALREALSL